MIRIIQFQDSWFSTFLITNREVVSKTIFFVNEVVFCVKIIDMVV